MRDWISAVGAALELSRRNPVRAHVRPQRFGNHHAAVGLLVVLQDGQPGAPDRQAAAAKAAKAKGISGLVRRLYELIDPVPSRHRDLVTAMAVAQVIAPDSKLAIARGLRDQTAATSLGGVLHLGSCDEDDLYAAMDYLAARQDTIQDALAARHLAGGTLVLYDVSSAAFEGRTCPLAREVRGHVREREREQEDQARGGTGDGGAGVEGSSLTGGRGRDASSQLGTWSTVRSSDVRNRARSSGRFHAMACSSSQIFEYPLDRSSS